MDLYQVVYYPLTKRDIELGVSTICFLFYADDVDIDSLAFHRMLVEHARCTGHPASNVHVEFVKVHHDEGD